MKRVIDGKKYDTETAELICDISHHVLSRSDFHYEESALYRTKKGAWFIAGEGGPMSRWKRLVGTGYSSGAGLEPVDATEAQRLLETYGGADLVEAYFTVDEA